MPALSLPMPALPSADPARLDAAAAECLAAKDALIALERVGGALQSGLHRRPGNAQRAVGEAARGAHQVVCRVAILGWEGAPRARTGPRNTAWAASLPACSAAPAASRRRWPS